MLTKLCMKQILKTLKEKRINHTWKGQGYRNGVDEHQYTFLQLKRLVEELLFPSQTKQSKSLSVWRNATKRYNNTQVVQTVALPSKEKTI